MKLKTLVRTCPTCSSRWEGMSENGEEVYIRYRWGYISVRYGEIGKTYFDKASELTVENMTEILGTQIEDTLDGWLEYDKLKRLLKEQLGWEIPSVEEVKKEIEE